MPSPGHLLRDQCWMVTIMAKMLATCHCQVACSKISNVTIILVQMITSHWFKILASHLVDIHVCCMVSLQADCHKFLIESRYIHNDKNLYYMNIYCTSIWTINILLGLVSWVSLVTLPITMIFSLYVYSIVSCSILNILTFELIFFHSPDIQKWK